MWFLVTPDIKVMLCAILSELGLSAVIVGGNLRAKIARTRLVGCPTGNAGIAESRPKTSGPANRLQ
jgi:hypothetical protein